MDAVESLATAVGQLLSAYIRGNVLHIIAPNARNSSCIADIHASGTNNPYGLVATSSNTVVFTLVTSVVPSKICVELELTVFTNPNPSQYHCTDLEGYGETGISVLLWILIQLL